MGVLEALLGSAIFALQKTKKIRVHTTTCGCDLSATTATHGVLLTCCVASNAQHLGRKSAGRN